MKASSSHEIQCMTLKAKLGVTVTRGPGVLIPPTGGGGWHLKKTDGEETDCLVSLDLCIILKWLDSSLNWFWQPWVRHTATGMSIEALRHSSQPIP